MLDPISINQVIGPKWLGPCNQQRSPALTTRKRSIKRAGDRGVVAEIAEEAHYKKRPRDTLKTLERATPTYRPCFHLALSLSLIDLACNVRSHFIHCIHPYSSIKLIFAYWKLITSLCSKDIVAYIILSSLD